MKKNILFVIDSLDVAGAEKSLVTLLSMLDFEKYAVDLMLFGHGGPLEKVVPEQVKILKPLKYTSYAALTVKESLRYSIKKNEYKMFFSRMKYSAKIRQRNYSNPQKARIFWESVANVIEYNPKTYDVAISYAQGVPTFYVAEKVKAKKKFAWVNVSYRLDENEKKFHSRFYNQYEKIIAVSDSTKDIFLESFPCYSDKMKVIYDINNPEFIEKMSFIGNSYDDQFNGIKLLTIGRLAHQKGYDIALEACKKLKKNGVNFRWYVLGKGPLKGEIEQFIKEHKLEDCFILLGVHANPYPFIKDADIYVQTSRFEGFGLAIAEARMLNVPVVTTRFDAVYNQMIEGANGLVVDMNAEAVYRGITEIINNEELRDNIIDYLKIEKKGNVEEIEKVLQLIQ
ncbi:glycosyltransferase [Domibacillus sp. PGB-M46]|uniref:glycosyltransferase n=1 Tax=Domibacillus sp. PGB-M46 TaxID=2910255 RepID=UPI001F596E08|nr:glycosyltransferase [Domibacillus sp. PGB-M46]MCI2255196.1 glycosyltransferase [Domibacillus sp. PGB-M46]